MKKEDYSFTKYTKVKTMYNLLSKFMLVSTTAILVMSGMALPTIATPITLEFEATVANIRSFQGGVPLPFDVDIDDRFTVTVTLDSEVGVSETIQNSGLEVQLPEFELSTSTFFLNIRNDVPSPLPPSGDIALLGDGPQIDLGPGTSDRISMSCGSLNGVLCDPFPHRKDSTWFIGLFLRDEEDKFDSEVPLDNLDFWNSLIFRELRITLFDENGPGSTNIGAFIGEARIVPEPSTFLIATLLLATSALKHRAWGCPVHC